MNDTLFDRVYGDGSDVTTRKMQEAAQAEQEKRERLLGASYESVRDGRTADAYSALLNGVGPGRASSDALERDMSDLSGTELLGLYGRDTGSEYLADVAQAEEQVYLDSNANRDFGHTVADTAKDVLGAALTGAEGAAYLASMPLPGVNDAMGALLTGTEEMLQENKSSYAKAKDRMYQAETEARKRDREAKDYSGGGRFLDEAIDAAAGWFNNPAHAAETVSSGLGSLIFGAGAGGLATKGVNAIARNRIKSSIAKEAAAIKSTGGAGATVAEATAAAEAAGLTGTQAELFVARQAAVRAEIAGAEPAVMEKLADQLLKAKSFAEEGSVLGHIKQVFPAVFANASSESGNNANQAFEKIMSYSHEDLLAGSTEYRERIALGQSPEKARYELARKGAQAVAAKTLPMHIASNFLVGKFESNPLGHMTNKNIIGNAGKEFLQETIEEGSGALFVNQSVKKYADNDMDEMDGVVTQAIEGGLAGAGMVGSLKAPNMVANAAINGVKSAARPVVETVQDKINEKKVTKEEESVAEATAQNEKVINDAVQTYARNQINSINADETLSPEEKTAKITEVENKVNTFAENAANPVTRESLVSEYGMSQAAVDTMFPDDGKPISVTRVANAMNNVLESEDLGGLSPDDFNTVARAVTTFVDKVSSGLRSVEEFIEMFPADEDFNQEIVDAFENTNAELAQSPAIARLIESQLEFLRKSPVPEDLSMDVTPDDTTLNHLVTKADLAPESMTADQIDIVLHHAKNSGKYTPEQIKSLEFVKGMISSAETIINDMKDKGELTPVGLVSENVFSLDAKDQRDDKTSVKEHFNNIQKAIKKGDIEGAKAYARDFQTFVQHMINKRNAVEMSKRLGDGSKITYTGYAPDGTPFLVKEGVYYNNSRKNNSKSEAFYNSLSMEAEFLNKTFNELAKAYPELNLEQLTGKSVNEEIRERVDRTITEEEAQAELDAREQAGKNPNQTTEQNQEKEIVNNADINPDDYVNKDVSTNNTIDENTSESVDQTIDEVLDQTTEQNTETTQNVDEIADDTVAEEKTEKPKDTKETKEPVSYEEMVQEETMDDSDLAAYGLTVNDDGTYSFINNEAPDTNNDAVVYDNFENNFDPFSDEDITLAHVETNKQSENTKEHSPISPEEFSRKGKKEGTKTVYKPAEKINGIVYFYDPNSTKDAAGFLPRTGEVYVNTALMSEKGNVESFAKKFLPSALKSLKLTPSQFADMFNNPKGGFDGLGAATFATTFLANKRKAMADGKYQFGKYNKLADNDTNAFMDGEIFARSLTPYRANMFDQISKNDLLILQQNPNLMGNNEDITKSSSNSLLSNVWKGIRTASRFAFVKSPAKMISSLIGSIADPNTEKYTKNGLFRNTVAREYRQFIEDNMDSLKAALNRELNAKLNKKFKNGGSIAQQLNDPNSEMHRLANLQSLNIAERNKDGSWSYNDHFIEMALLAAMQEFISRENTFADADPAILAEALGTDISNISESTMEAMSKGTTAAQLHGSLANKIGLYWGLKSGQDSSVGVVKGVPSAVAGDIIDVMTNFNYSNDNSGKTHTFFQKTAIKVPFSNDDMNKALTKRKAELVKEGRQEEANKLTIEDIANFKTVNTIQFGDIADKYKNISKIPSVIDDTILRAKPDGYQLGKPFEVGNTTRDGAQLTDKNRKSLKSMNNTPYQPVAETISFVDSLGVDTLNDILHPETKGDLRKFNKVARQSAESRRSVLKTAINTVKNLVEAYNEEGAKGVGEDLKIYFKNFMSTERRIHQSHPGPAGSSSSRAFFTATNREADLTDLKNLGLYQIAMAQGLGINTGKLTEEAAIREYNELVTEISPLLDAINELRQAQENNTDMSKAQKKVVSYLDGYVQSGKIDGSMVAIHNLLELARFVNTDAKGKKNFQTNIFIEIDGTNSGPALGALAFGNNLFDPSFIDTLAAGGILIDENHFNRTFNELIEKGEIRDNYQRLADAITSDGTIFSQEDLTGSTRAPIEQKSKFAMSNLFKHFNGNLAQEGGVYKATRNFVKNLLTVLVYGSGDKGVAANYTEDIIKNAYLTINKAAVNWWGSDEAPNAEFGKIFFPEERDPKVANRKALEMFKSLNDSMRYYYDYDEEGRPFVRSRKAPDRPFPETMTDMLKTDVNFWRDYTFQRSDIENITNFLTEGFAAPARKIANKVMTEEVMEGLRSVNAMANIASNTYVALVESEKNKLLRNKREAQDKLVAEGKPRTWFPSDYLTRAEIKAIEEKAKSALRIKTIGGLNNITLSKHGRTTTNAEFGRSINGHFGDNSSVDQLSSLGAAATPFANIGFGEAAVMQYMANLRGEKDGAYNATNVHDGTNMSPFEAELFGKQANEAISKVVTEKNILKEYVDTAKRIFENFESITEGMTESEIESLMTSLLGPVRSFKGGKMLNKSQLLLRLRNDIYKAERHAALVEASHQMLQETNMTYQNYNGIESAGYKQDGKYTYNTPEWQQRYHALRTKNLEAVEKMPLPKEASHRNMPLFFNGKTYVVPNDSKLSPRTKNTVTYRGVEYKSITDAVVKGLKNTPNLTGVQYRNAFIDMLKNIIKSDPELLEQVRSLGDRRIKVIRNTKDGKSSDEFYSRMLNYAKREIIAEDPVSALNAKQNAPKDKKEKSVEINLQGQNHKSIIRALAEANIVVEPNSVADRIIRQAAKDGKISDLSIHIGDMDTLLNEHNVDTSKIDSGTLNGIYFNKDGVSPTILVSNKATAETVAHELVHARTAQAIAQRVINPNRSLSDSMNMTKAAAAHVERAIDDLGTQMDRFMDKVSLSLKRNPNGAIPDGVMEIYGQMQSYINSGERHKAIMEFASWATTNNDVEAYLKGMTEGVNDNFWGKEMAQASKLLAYIVKAISHIMGIDVTNPEFKNLHERVSFNVFTISEGRNRPTDPSGKSNGDIVLAHSTNPNNRGETNNIINSMNSAYNSVLESKRDGLNQAEKVLFNRNLEQHAFEVSELMTETMALSRMDLNPDERVAYTNLVTAMTMDATIGSDVMLYAQDLFDIAIENIKVEDFLADPKNDDPFDYQRAQDKYDALFAGIGKKSSFGVPMNLANFIALTTINPEYTKLLNGISIPKSKGKGSLDSFLRSMASNMADNLIRNAANSPKNAKTIGDAIGFVTETFDASLIQRANALTAIEDSYTSMKDKINDYAVELIDTAGNKTERIGKSLANTSQTKLGKAAGKAIELIGKTIADKDGDATKLGLEMIANKEGVANVFRALITDFVGLSKQNKPVYHMIKKIKAFIQRARQSAIENIPQQLSDKFKERLSKEDWTTLHKSIGRADIASILKTLPYAQAVATISNDTNLNMKISDLESSLSQIDPKRWNRINKKAEQLAQYLVDGTVGNNLLVNAEQISRLQGENTNSPDRAFTQKEINDLDTLISLKAFAKQSKYGKNRVRYLLKNEKEGMETVIKYMHAMAQTEASKALKGSAGKVNARKGYLPFIGENDKAIVVIADSHAARYKRMGYVRIGDYKGGSADPDIGKSRGYYFLNAPSNAPFHQGIVQNVKSTFSGADDLTGASTNPIGGLIRDKAQVKRIHQRMQTDPAYAEREGLIPLYYKENSSVPYAYERSLDPQMMDKLNPNYNLAEQIGVWKGRQIEESMAEEANRALVDASFDMYEEAVKNDYADQFINVMDPEVIKNDPVLKDALSLMPTALKEYVNSTYDGKFMVRRSMLEDTFGYRASMASDLWNGVSRVSEPVRNTVRDAIELILGDGAYRKLMKAQSGLQNLVQDARTLIVVKSVVVPAVNIAANVLQNVARGIPITDIYKYYKRSFNEINYYVKENQRLQGLELDYEVAKQTDPARAKEIHNKMEAIRESFDRLAIKPLIDAGEFTSVSMSQVYNDYTDLSTGSVDSLVEGWVDRLPKGIRTIGKYAIVSSDTAMYEAMQKLTDYGDFVSKYALYEHLTKKKGVSQEDALDAVTDEYVNYDKLPGRFRHAAENNGLMWFWNWKIRTTKIGISMLRNNPIGSIFAMNMGDMFLPFKAGLPFEDSVLGRVLGNGSLSRSVGTDMFFDAWKLNPWYALYNKL